RELRVRAFGGWFVRPDPDPGAMVGLAIEIERALGGRVVLPVVPPLGLPAVHEGPHDARPLLELLVGGHLVLRARLKPRVLLPDLLDVCCLTPGKKLLEAHSPRHLDDLPGVTHGFAGRREHLVEVLGPAPGGAENAPRPVPTL